LIFFSVKISPNATIAELKKQVAQQSEFLSKLKQAKIKF
jgi:hypothetical protein